MTVIASLMYCLGTTSLLFRPSLGGLAPSQYTALPTLTPLNLPAIAAAEPTSTYVELPTVPTDTPMPTATRVIAHTPSPSSSPSPTASATLTPSTAPASPTVPTATETPTIPTPYPTPILSSPSLDNLYHSGDKVVLQWKWNGVLADNEWFDVQVWHEGEQPHGIAWSEETFYELTPDQAQPGQYYWRIVVLKYLETAPDGNKIWEPLTEPSVTWRFTIQ